MAGPGRQLVFELMRDAAPSPAAVELAETRARKAGRERIHQPGVASPRPAPQPDHAEPALSPSKLHVPPDVPERSRTELAAALELRLRARFGEGLGRLARLRLTITDNRRTMVSLRRPKNGALVEVRLHHMFLHAEPEIWVAVGDYLFADDPSTNREPAAQIARYIERHRQTIRRPERRPVAVSPAGNHHDLQAICHAINQRYFDGKAQVQITWARENPARPAAARRSIKLGSYTSRDRLIRVHPALDAAFVPKYFVEYIVYHEMLHHVLPPKLHNGRRELHGPGFQAREREFQHFDAALRWESENLSRLLGSRARVKAEPR